MAIEKARDVQLKLEFDNESQQTSETINHTAESLAQYGIPMYQTRLVCESELKHERIKINDPEDIAALLQNYYKDRDREEFIVVFLNRANIVIGLHVASVGGLSQTIVEPRQVFKAAFLASAASIICAHNHPSGETKPSHEDIAMTRILARAGLFFRLPVLDHIIIGDSNFCSLREDGEFDFDNQDPELSLNYP